MIQEKKLEDVECVEYLQSLRFLYGEALRLKDHDIADVLEVAFVDLSYVLEQKKKIEPDNAIVIEFILLKKFRRLDNIQKETLIEFIENIEKNRCGRNN